MNKLFVTLLLLNLVLIVSAQKVIENPNVGISTESRLKITQIEITGDETILSFHALYPTGSGIGIRLKSFIQIVGQPDSLFMTKQDTPPKDATGWIPIPEGGLKYKLHFPPIDPATAKIDFGEPDAKGWKIFDIKINENVNNLIIPKELSGHWFHPDSGKWTFSFLEKVAVYKNKTWEYVSAKPAENSTEVKLKNGDNITTLFCRTDGAGHCFIQNESGTMIRYSNNSELLSGIYDDRIFESPVIKPGKAKYSGLINGYTSRIGTSTGILRFYNRFTNQQESHIVKVNEHGIFSVEFLLDYPQEITVRLPSGSEKVFFEPGKEVFQLINTGIAEHPSLFMGETAAINLGLKATSNVTTPQQQFLEGITEMDDNQYTDYVLTTRKKEIDKVKKIMENKNYSNKASQIRFMDIDLRAISNLLRFNQNKRMATFYTNRKLKQEEQKTFKPQMFDVQLFKKLNLDLANSKFSLLSNEYFNILQSLKHTDFNYPQGTFYHLLTVLGDELKKQDKTISGEESDMLNFIKSFLVDDYDDTKAMDFNKTYREVVNKFCENNKDEYTKITEAYYSANIKKNCETIFGESGNQLLETSAIQNFLVKQRNSTKLLEEQYEETKRTVLDNVLKEYLISAFYKMKAEIKIANSDGEVELKTDGDKLFHSIIKDFKGKVVYVDFWATWCSPCKAGIEQIKPLKEELKNKDIVFVYITNNTSPDKLYHEMIPAIKGEHFKVSADEWNFLTQKFNIYGIPHYALVNKKGKIVKPHMMHLDNDELKEVLMEQIKK